MLLRGLLFRGAAPDSFFGQAIAPVEMFHRRSLESQACFPCPDKVANTAFLPTLERMLRFSLFGFPVSVHWMFWLMVAMLGGGMSADTPREFQALILWVLAAFISIIIHELGHAFLQRRYGARAEIHLYAFGGLAIANRNFTRTQDILISLAGPVVQILCGVLIGQLLRHSSGDAWPVTVFLASFYTVSIFWGLFNLVPIFPLDGGHVLRSLLGPRNEKLAYLVGVICAAGFAVYMLLVWKSMWNTILFAMLAWQNFQRFQGEAPPPLMRP